MYDERSMPQASDVLKQEQTGSQVVPIQAEALIAAKNEILALRDAAKTKESQLLALQQALRDRDRADTASTAAQQGNYLCMFEILLRRLGIERALSLMHKGNPCISQSFGWTRR